MDFSSEEFFGTAASQAQAADEYASMMEDLMLEFDDLDIENCPPDRRFFRPGKEAWVYEHGNICELVFVRVGDE
jgi:hypothetical protein